VTKYMPIRLYKPIRRVTNRLVCSGHMADAAPSAHSLATASGLLLGTTGACMAAGALVGWLAGSWGLGLLVGAIVGIPAAIFMVYKAYT
jgi:F0F1-type ATP synthase assembly protein I